MIRSTTMSSAAVDDILATVSTWPVEERLELINRLLESVRASAETRRSERVLALRRVRAAKTKTSKK
jgi:hypothetical protein